jgi:hypothetical protein
MYKILGYSFLYYFFGIMITVQSAYCTQYACLENIISVPPNDSVVYRKLLVIDYNSFEKKPLDKLLRYLDKIGCKNIDIVHLERPMGTLRGFYINFSKNVYLRLDITSCEYNRPLDSSYWKLKDLRRERISNIRVGYRGKTVKTY